MSVGTNEACWAVDDGWKPIVRDAINLLHGCGCTIVQVKEKFGGLRIYYDYPDIGEKHRDLLITRCEEIVKAAEAACWRTCEACGSTTNVTTCGFEPRAWLTTYCDACREVPR